MNRFQRAMQTVAKNLFGITFGTSSADTWEYATRFNLGLPLYADRGQITEPYRQSSAVAIAISRIANDAASVPWEVWPEERDEDTEPIDGHPLLDLWAKPNEYMVGTQLWIGTYISKLLFGEAFWYYPDLVVRRADAPTMMRGRGSIELLDPRCVLIKRGSDGRPMWLHRVEGVDYPLDERYLTVFKRWNPYNPLRGLSKIESVIADLSGDHAAAQWNERFFSDQNGIPSGILKPAVGANLTSDQREDLRRNWNQRHSGTKRSVAIVPPGWDFESLGISQHDMGFRELREYGREQILAAFGVPPFLAGVLDKANYANAREQKEIYWQHTLHEFLTSVQETLNFDFLTKVRVEGVAVYPKWEMVNALLEDLAEKTAVAKDWFAMGLSKKVINERLEMGWNSDDIGDYEIGYLPMNLIPSELASDTSTYTEPAPAPPDAEDETEPPEEGQAKGTTEDPIAREKRRAMVWRNIIGNTRDLEREFEKKIRSHFKNLADEAKSRLDRIQNSYQVQRLAGVTKSEIDLFDMEEANREIRRATKKTYEATVKRGGTTVFTELSAGLSFNLQDPRVIALLAELSGRIKGVNQTLEKQMRVSLLEGLGESETVDQLRDRVDRVLDVGLTRARTIARTETGFAFNGGRFNGMYQAGVEKHEWLSSRDADVRDSHAELDGEVVDVGLPFSNGLLHPLDPAGEPSEVIACRCTSVPARTRE